MRQRVVLKKLFVISMPKYSKSFHYYLFYKPYGVLSQFTPEQAGDVTLAAFYSFPPDVYPVGRLDKDSEGLLLLTNDNRLKNEILQPGCALAKTYWVQKISDG